MRKIREVLRLKFEVGLSARQIAVSVQIGRVTVSDYLTSLGPLPVLMMVALALALVINYPRLADQKARIAAHSESVLNVLPSSLE